MLQSVLQSAKDGEIGPDEVPLVIGSHPILGGTYKFVAAGVAVGVAVYVAVCVAECCSVCCSVRQCGAVRQCAAM